MTAWRRSTSRLPRCTRSNFGSRQTLSLNSSTRYLVWRALSRVRSSLLNGWCLRTRLCLAGPPEDSPAYLAFHCIGFGSYCQRAVAVGVLTSDRQHLVHAFQKGVEQFRVEVLCAPLVHDVDGLLDGKRRFVDTLAGERVESIRDRSDASF